MGASLPNETKWDAHEGLRKVFQDVGVPYKLVIDNALEEIKENFKKVATEHDTRVQSTEPYYPWQNSCEGAIREGKRDSQRKWLK